MIERLVPYIASSLINSAKIEFSCHSLYLQFIQLQWIRYCNNYLHSIYVRNDLPPRASTNYKRDRQSNRHSVSGSRNLNGHKKWVDRIFVCWLFWSCWRPLSPRRHIRISLIISIRKKFWWMTNFELSITIAWWTLGHVWPKIKNISKVWYFVIYINLNFLHFLIRDIKSLSSIKSANNSLQFILLLLLL